MADLQPIPLFGTGIAAIAKAITAQRRLNCFWIQRSDKDKTDAALVGTPGLLLWTALNTYPVRGWRVVGNFLYVVSGSALYQVTTAGVATLLGTLNVAVTGKVSMSDNTAQLALVDGSALYIYSITNGNYYQSAFNTAGHFGTVTDFTSQVAGFSSTITFFDGRFVVEMQNSRQCYASAVYDGTDWGGAPPPNGLGAATGYFTKENFSDQMSAVDSFSGFLILWGLASLEYWQDVGTSPLPYARINGATQQWGLAAKWSRQILSDNSVIFLGLDSEGHAKVCQIGKNGYGVVPVSTSDVDDIINDMGYFADAVALTYVAFGTVIYQLTFPTGGRTLLYDTLIGAWGEAQTGLDLSARHVGDLGIAFNGQNYMSDYQSGNIYQASEYAYTDNGVSIKRQIVTRHIRNAGNDLSIGDVFLDMETGVGLESGQGSDPQITLEKSKDNGRTFGQPRPKPLGKVGQYLSPRVIWRRNGTAKDFVFRFTMTDPVRFIVTGGGVSR